MTQAAFEFQTFRGIDNVSDPLKLSSDKRGTWLQEAENVDVDLNNMVRRRGGYKPVYSGAVHSLWSEGDQCFFVEAADLKRLNPDWTATTLLSDIGASRMNFVAVRDKVYFSNLNAAGWIKNGSTFPFPQPTQQFKKRMVGGQLLEYYDARLYAAQDDKIFYSDPLDLAQMDERRNFKQFSGRITMMKAVMNGMYVSTAKACYFLAGKDPGEMAAVQILDFPAIEGTALKALITFRESEMIAVYWMTEFGIYAGLPEGRFLSLTDRYNLDSGQYQGSAMIKADQGYDQYIALLNTQLAANRAEVDITLPSPSIIAEGA